MSEKSAYKASSVYRTSPPIFTDWAQCQAYPGVAGDIGYVPRLIGAGYFAVQYTGTSWEVVPGQSIVCQSSPVTLGAAPSTAVRTSNLVTLPAGIITDCSVWEFMFPSSTGANTGSDTFNFLFGGISVGSFTMAANSYSVSSIRLARDGANAERPWSVTVTTQAAAAPVAVNFANSVLIQAAITPATIGNTERIRYFGIARVN